VRELGLTLDLPWQRVRGQARRMAALRHLKCLARVECAAPLGPESLRALRAAAGGRLRALQLDMAPRMHCPSSCLDELCRLDGLEELMVAYNAGRTLTHAAPLGALTNLRRLGIWIGSYHAAPPWSSRPLPDLLPTVATLSGVSEFRLLQGLRRPSDVQQLAMVTWLPNLVSLGLHDTVLGLDDLMVLARCKGLASLAVDALQLTGSCHGPVMMRRLRSMRVNVVNLGHWGLDELFPSLIRLGPFKDTLGPRCGRRGLAAPKAAASPPRLCPKRWRPLRPQAPPCAPRLTLPAPATPSPPSPPPSGYGVSMPLSAIEGNRQLESLTLMLGALRGPGARSAADVARVLRTLPALRELALLGAAGGYDANGGGSAALTLALAEHLVGPGSPGSPGRATPPSSPGGPGSPGGPWRGFWRPRGLRRLELVAWGAAGGADALLPRVRRVAPGLEVVVREEWVG
jgi:hypothetical protein